eukprot:12888610-Ditylum_brightwellii.AAC.1
MKEYVGEVEVGVSLICSTFSSLNDGYTEIDDGDDTRDGSIEGIDIVLFVDFVGKSVGVAEAKDSSTLAYWLSSDTGSMDDGDEDGKIVLSVGTLCLSSLWEGEEVANDCEGLKLGRALS